MASARWFVSTVKNRRVSGIIVETEAYLPKGDSACHGQRGKTPGNRSMFGRAGLAYIYPIHGKHCFNVVTQQPEEPCAVLIRSLEPESGVPTMKLRRNQENDRLLTTGPGRLCQALSLDRGMDGYDLTSGTKLWLEPAQPVASNSIKVTPRIGVTSAANRKLRFVVEGNAYVSGPKKWR